MEHISLSLYIYIYIGALLGEPGEGDSPAGDPVGYERKALETGISLHWGLCWATWSGLIYWGLREMVERGSGSGASLSLSLSVCLWKLCEGTCRGDSLAGSPKG